MTGLTVPTTAAVSSLRQALIQHGYAAILQALIPTEGHERAFCDFGRVARACEKLGDESAALLRLFALGEKLPLRLAERLFDREALGGLIGCGLLREPSGGEVQTAGYAVVSYRGFCCVADLPPRYPTAVRLRRDVVIDDDTLALARVVNHAGEHIVEAFWGGGML